MLSGNALLVWLLNVTVPTSEAWIDKAPSEGRECEWTGLVAIDENPPLNGLVRRKR